MVIYVNNIPMQVSNGSDIDKLYKENKITANRLVGCIINNRFSSLKQPLNEYDDVKLVTIDTTDGQRIYKKSTSFLFFFVCKKMYPSLTFECIHSLSRGELFQVLNGNLNNVDIEEIKKEMKSYINNKEKITFHKSTLKNPVYKEFIENKYDFSDYVDEKQMYLYEIDGYFDLLLDYIVPDCGYLYDFDLIKDDGGILLMIPKKSNPEIIETRKNHQKLTSAFNEMSEWAKIHGIYYLHDLNDKIRNDEGKDIIEICEALQENKFSVVSDEIIRKNTDIICITGPSSSGKTTTAHRIEIQLKVKSKKPFMISMDDYFIDRKDMQRDKNGEIDFEHISCVNLEELKKQINELLSGKPVHMRRFDFKKGTGFYEDNETILTDNSILIIEGIHALNPIVQDILKEHSVYKISINPLTMINIDHHNRLSSSDMRKIRRIVRDLKFRGTDAEKTLSMWKNIRRGEERNIYPYLEHSDATINTTLIYETAVLKEYALTALNEVSETSDFKAEANRLIKTLNMIESIKDETAIPPNSLLKEFIGI